MPFRPVQLPDEVPGRLWLSAMPGHGDGWQQFVADAKAAQLGLAVCLTPREEMDQLSPPYARAVSRNEAPFEKPSSWMLLPARNFGVPNDPRAFRQGIAAIAQRLKAGESVMLHCAAGMGRTGTAAACVLKALGLETEEALQRVRDAGSNPQNALQSGMVEWF
jgi:hypothetical protein